MKIKITGRNIDLTDGLKNAVEDKLSKLEKYFTPDTDVYVTLSVEKERQKVEVTIPAKGNIIRSEQVSNDMYVSIDLVEEVDERVAESTAFIREMSEESEGLVAFAKGEEAKAWCKKVSKAFRYSDPVSVGELADIEFAIEQHFQVFAKAVREGDDKVLTETAETLLAEIASRNGKCKRTKSGVRSRYTSSRTEKK